MFELAKRLLQLGSWPMLLSALLLSLLRQGLGSPESARGSVCADRETSSRDPLDRPYFFRPTPAGSLARPVLPRLMAGATVCAGRIGADVPLDEAWLLRTCGPPHAEHWQGERSSCGVLRPLRLMTAQCALLIKPSSGDARRCLNSSVQRSAALRVFQL